MARKVRTKRQRGGVNAGKNVKADKGDIVGRNKIININLMDNNAARVLTFGAIILGILYVIIFQVLLNPLVSGLLFPAPPAFASAAPDEALIIIAKFDDRSDGQFSGIDPAQRIYDLIDEKLPSNKVDLRVEQYNQVIIDRNEARSVLETYNATILIWGWYDKLGAKPTIELDKDKTSLSNSNSQEFNLATPESIYLRFTEDIPAEAGYISFFSLGMMFINVSTYDIALDFFTQAIESANVTRSDLVKPWEALMWRGNIYAWTKQYDLSIEDYDKAVELHPHREGYFNRAAAYSSLGKVQQAAADFSKAIEIDPNYKDAYYWRGKSNYSTQKYGEAIADFSKAIEIDPNYKDAYYWRGRSNYYTQKYDEAIADFSSVIEIDPDHIDAHYWRGLGYYLTENDDEAIADFSSVVEIDPNYKGAYYWRGSSNYYTQKYDEAIADFSSVIEIDPNYKDAYYWRGKSNYSTQKYDEAIADFSSAIEIDPNHADAYYRRGIVYKDVSNNYEVAVSDITKATELLSNNASYILTLGNTYADWEKYDEAVAEYLKSIGLKPDPYTFCVLGITYTKMGDFPLAIESLSQGVDLDVESSYPWCLTALENAQLGIPTP